VFVLLKYQPGEEIEVVVDREGLGEDEGIAHLPDDTMVVVVGAGSKVGQMVQAVISTVYETFLGHSILANAK
jgi:uncharacterized protein YacL